MFVERLRITRLKLYDLRFANPNMPRKYFINILPPRLANKILVLGCYIWEKFNFFFLPFKCQIRTLGIFFSRPEKERVINLSAKFWTYILITFPRSDTQKLKRKKAFFAQDMISLTLSVY